MVKQYTIVGFGRTGRYLDFADAILVKLVSADELDYYRDIQDDPAYEEEQMQCEHWLMFKNYPGKLQQIRRKAEDCQDGKVWYLDLENDFVLRSTSITNQQTGEGFIRPIYQVIMVNPDLDIIDAKAKGESYKGRNAAEKHLDELGLALEGDDEKYYVIGKDASGEYYGIQYNYTEEFHGMFYVDAISINAYNGHITPKRHKVGVYNPMTGEVVKFAQ